MRALPARVLSCFLALTLTLPATGFAASHREAPITALDQKADITDWFAFVSFNHPDRVTMILNVDPFLEPSNGPNYFPFDPGILYEMHVDNDNDASKTLPSDSASKVKLACPAYSPALSAAWRAFRPSRRWTAQALKAWANGKLIRSAWSGTAGTSS